MNMKSQSSSKVTVSPIAPRGMHGSSYSYSCLFDSNLLTHRIGFNFGLDHSVGPLVPTLFEDK